VKRSDAYPENWIFLGDSLTEGVGSERISYVSEYVKLLRARHSRCVEEVRLRRVNPVEFNPFLRVNLAVYMDHDERQANDTRCWLWNLASEGTTVDSDMHWLPFMANLRPARVFILRGALESILRPVAMADNVWPWWIPHAWRSYAAMDPRCYFSTTGWRRLKQLAENKAKQSLRLALMKHRPGKPLQSQEIFVAHFESLLRCLKELTNEIHVIGLPPVGGRAFPGSRQAFVAMNERIKKSALAYGANFIDSFELFEQQSSPADYFYLDEFHPNQAGARLLAKFLDAHCSSADSA